MLSGLKSVQQKATYVQDLFPKQFTEKILFMGADSDTALISFISPTLEQHIDRVHKVNEYQKSNELFKVEKGIQSFIVSGMD